MILYINTSDNQKTIVDLDNKRLERPTGPDKSQQVLGLINEILGKNKKTLKDITEIKVETGPGSFTGLRVGVAVANTLGWLLKIPVNGKRINKNDIIEPIYE
jgi:tRNA threonylcarbamoyladenosine biosynthesis protein TsaB